MSADLQRTFRDLAPAVDFCSLRYVRERSQQLSVRQDVVQPVESSDDAGAMITVLHGGGLGYAATGDLSPGGIKQAIDAAKQWADQTAGQCVVDFKQVKDTAPTGEFETKVAKPWQKAPLSERIDLLRRECGRLKTDDRIVDWSTSLWCGETESLYLTAGGGRVSQRLHWLTPNQMAVAFKDGESQKRTFGGRGYCRQAGLELLDELGYYDAAPQIAEEALELLAAPDCPTGTKDLLLAPDQMVLQIHESIGHPLELDRILGDERNYAGTSFVTPDMIGSYQYGSKLLNITFDPTVESQLASYAFDDDGTPATREFLIKDGILIRVLGGAISQMRAGLPGVANARAHGWKRPPIDRMANLNLEPGDSSFDEMVAAVDDGVYMQTNCAWSIDDSRNKFQFGCERGRLIKNGKLAGVVKNCNYRGISATFWRNLKMVGNPELREIMGTPFCGKGEPNQLIRVGHAMPPALFADVDVFGGA